MPATVPTYYDVLQVERHAAPERVRAAYRKLAQKYHPDRMPGNANATRAMAAINAAYDVLSDAQRRAEHDRWIRRAERSAAVAPAAPEVPQDLWAYLHPARNWSWYLLFGTMAVAFGTIGTALYLAAMPARAAPPVTDAPCRVATNTSTVACRKAS